MNNWMWMSSSWALRRFLDGLTQNQVGVINLPYLFGLYSVLGDRTVAELSKSS